jgi:hypothetical protein
MIGSADAPERSHMSKFLNLLLTIAMGAAPTLPLTGADHLAATLSPARESFVAGEPIDLSFAIRNTTSTTVTVSAAGPFFISFQGDIGLKVTSEPGTKARATSILWNPWFAAPGDPVTGQRNLVINMKVPMVSLKPGETSSTPVFAQQYLGDPGPGTYSIAYSVAMSTRTQGLAGPPVKGDGSFKIVVSPGSNAQLAQALAFRVDAQKSTDFRVIKTATEGLLLVNSPAVIPYLLQIKPLLQPYDEVVLAMAKFKGNREATEFVLSKLRTGDAAETVPALYVLQRWGYVLPENEVSLLLWQGSPDARLAALRYVYNLPGRPHLAQVKGLTADRDGGVAEAARRVLDDAGAGKQKAQDAR